MNIQHILTLSIDAIFLCSAAMMTIDFTIAVVRLWRSCEPHPKVCAKSPKDFQTSDEFVCAATLAPIWDEDDDKAYSRLEELRKELVDIKEKYLDFEPHPKVSCSSPKAEDSPKEQTSRSVVIHTHLTPNANSASIRQLKKQASVAKIKNYNVMTKAQLIQALSA